MKVYLDAADGQRTARLPYDQADHVVVAGACPACKNEPFKVRGTGIQRRDHDTYYADAICCGCGQSVGRLRTVVSTVFGIEEDERVLNGRCRVY